MKTIELTQDQVALVDEDDFAALNQFSWYAAWSPSARGYYAVRKVPIGGGKQAMVRMHRVITGAQKGFDVDHVNMRTLDNRKGNLRICTRSENQRNRGKQASNTSGFKGVYWNEQRRQWQAFIKLNGKQRHLGYYDNAIDAAAAYDRACAELHGSFARHNGTAPA